MREWELAKPMANDIISYVLKGGVAEGLEPWLEVFDKISIRGGVGGERVGEDGILVGVDSTLVRAVIYEKGVALRGIKLAISNVPGGPPEGMAQILQVQGGVCIMGALQDETVGVDIPGAIELAQEYAGFGQAIKKEIANGLDVGLLHGRPYANIEVCAAKCPEFFVTEPGNDKLGSDHSRLFVRDNFSLYPTREVILASLNVHTFAKNAIEIEDK